MVGADEYSHEVSRVVEFLASDGHSLLDSIGAARDQLSKELLFEEAARLHKRLEKIEEVLKLRDELSKDVNQLHGVAITGSTAPDSVELWFVREGHWQQERRFSFEVQEGKTISLDRKLRELAASLDFRTLESRRAPGVSCDSRALVLLQLARRRMGAIRQLRKDPLPQTGARSISRSEFGGAVRMSGTSQVGNRLLLLAAAVLFSTGGAAIKATSLTGWQIASFRAGVAAAVLLALIPGSRTGWSWRAALVGIAYASMLVLFVLATKLTTAADAIFLQSTAPLYLLLLSPWLLHERIQRADVFFSRRCFRHGLILRGR